MRYTICIAHGDGSTTGETHYRESSSNLKKLIKIALEKYQYENGWNAYVWIIDGNNDQVWIR